MSEPVTWRLFTSTEIMNSLLLLRMHTKRQYAVDAIRNRREVAVSTLIG